MATEQERNRGAGAYSTPGVDVKPDLTPAQIITGAPEVKFSHTNLGPPSNLYITREDALKVNVWNSAPGLSINVNYRLLRFDGVIVPNAFNLTPTTNRARNAFIFPLVEGFLLSVQLFTNTGGSLRGQTFVYVEICRPPSGTVIGYESLLSDYLTNNDTLSWPGGRVQQSVEGPGFVHSVAVTTPAAGADWAQTIPTNARWRFISGRAQLATSAAVANRVPEFNPSDAGAISVGIGTPNQVVPASQTVNICYSPSVPTVVANVADVVTLATPVISTAGFTLNSRTLNIQAADQYSGINLLVEEWIET